MFRFKAVVLALAVFAVLIGSAGATAGEVAQRTYLDAALSLDSENTYAYLFQTGELNTNEEAALFLAMMGAQMQMGVFPMLEGLEFEVTPFELLDFGSDRAGLEASGYLEGFGKVRVAAVFVQLDNLGHIAVAIGGSRSDPMRDLNTIMEKYVPSEQWFGVPPTFEPEGSGLFLTLPTEREVGIELFSEETY